MQTIVTATQPISAPDDDHHRHAQEEYAVKRQNERETGREWAGLDWTNPVRDEIATAWLRRSRSICAGVYEPRKAILRRERRRPNPSFSANPPYCSLSFFYFRFHYMDFPDCLLLLLSISVFILFSFFPCFYTFLVFGSVR